MAKFNSDSAREAGHRSSRKGVPNRIPKQARLFISDFLGADQEAAETDWNDLTPWERWQMRARLMEFVVPKLQRSETTIDVSRLSDDEVDRLFNAAVQKLQDER